MRTRRRLIALCAAGAMAAAMPVAVVSAHNQSCPLITVTSCQYDSHESNGGGGGGGTQQQQQGGGGGGGGGGGSSSSSSSSSGSAGSGSGG